MLMVRFCRTTDLPTNFTTILLRVILGRLMFMMAETPTRIPAFYSPEPLAGTQDTLWLIVG
jgi:hypothetical protein